MSKAFTILVFSTLMGLCVFAHVQMTKHQKAREAKFIACIDRTSGYRDPDTWARICQFKFEYDL